MLSALVVAASLVWLGLLFGAAVWGERHPEGFARRWSYVYALSLAAYCTSWTFYGTVTQAARSGWWLPPTFVGTILLYVFGFGALQRLVRLVQETHSTSIADLVAARLGKDSRLAAAITLVAILGIVPYIALQLKAVAMSFGLLTRASPLEAPPWQDSALYVALVLALFAMLFGTRSVSTAEHNRGLVLAIALESLLKLGAMLAIGAWVLLGYGWPAPPPAATTTASGFPGLVVLGILALFTLPHLYHVGVAECRDVRHLATARWLFPLYMGLIALPLLPLARAGESRLGGLGVPSDLYVLALPLADGNGALALLAFLGGLSAATGMVIVATLALSLMIGNHWLTPLLVRGAWRQNRGDLRASVLRQRRLAILIVVLLAWIYSRATSGSEALADIGALSFSGLGTLAPAVLFAVLRPQTPPRAMLWGLAAGVVVWAWCLLVPTLATPDWLDAGPFGIGWLAPDHLFGLSGWSRLTRAVMLSLLVETTVTLLLAARATGPQPVEAGELDVATLRGLGWRFLAPERVDLLIGEPRSGLADPGQVERVERELATVFGAASARLLLDAARRARGRDLDTVATIVGEASQALRFNQRLLEAALENMTQGISVVDRELNLVAWNARYAQLFGFPADLLRVGRPIATLAAHALRSEGHDEARIARMVVRRLDHMRAGTPLLSERRFPDGSLIEIRGNPMPGGGFVATFTDVTAFRQAEADLKQVAEHLEQRVADRTAELARASAAAEQANQAKTRLLAAVSHDLAQPLNAAHLFVHALVQRLAHPEYREALGHIDGALGSAEELLAGLLDVSRLDAGGLVPARQSFRVDTLLRGLAAEFGVLAQQKGLRLAYVASSAWLDTDPQLLRRVLQNFLANAVRYTPYGRIVIGGRRRGDRLRIEIWDSGPGIAAADRTVIFEEFRRLGRDGQGLGLGLSIAERIARLLGLPLSLRSWPGRGSVFAIDVPFGQPQPQAPAAAPPPPAQALRGRVLVVDNDAAVRAAMTELLAGWQFQVLAAADADEAARLCASGWPDLLVVDFHLDAGSTGLQLREALPAPVRARPCIVVTADHGEAVRAAVAATGCHLLYKPLKPLALKSLMARLL
ncbi:hybrid sensor histidine kinase/response regulator [Dokdonella koreensis]|uniref:histidine kinase n=1 Tax=Dokdonella koreensis DS-123 TaxID=1300342 RepID=A0A170R0T8_9GAMM|nr:PAS-domain containing protein [Dokdonella koreensis]ANB16051.1 Sensor histidine kinase [Dokdonella koreensis DS-123]